MPSLMPNGQRADGCNRGNFRVDVARARKLKHSQPALRLFSHPQDHQVPTRSIDLWNRAGERIQAQRVGQEAKMYDATVIRCRETLDANLQQLRQDRSANLTLHGVLASCRRRSGHPGTRRWTMKMIRNGIAGDR